MFRRMIQIHQYLPFPYTPNRKSPGILCKPSTDGFLKNCIARKIIEKERKKREKRKKKHEDTKIKYLG